MILFFDTETTGLPKNWKAPVTDLDNWPRLVQIAYLLFDLNGNKISSGEYIIKPNDFKIPNESSRIHGISNERAIAEGHDISSVLIDFKEQIEKSSYIVAHNMSYDEKIVGAEFLRAKMPNYLSKKVKICTMESSTNFCAIDGPYGYKWPKLSELHYKLFNTDFEEAHNAAIDINATAKCFWELIKKRVINIHDVDVNKIAEQDTKIESSETSELKNQLKQYCKENNLKEIPIGAKAEAIMYLESKFKQINDDVSIDSEFKFLRDYWARNDSNLIQASLNKYQKDFLFSTKKLIINEHSSISLFSYEKNKSIDDKIMRLEILSHVKANKTEKYRNLVILLYYYYLSCYDDFLPQNKKPKKINHNKLSDYSSFPDCVQKCHESFEKQIIDFRSILDNLNEADLPDAIIELVRNCNKELICLKSLIGVEHKLYIESSTKIVKLSTNMLMEWIKGHSILFTGSLQGSKLVNDLFDMYKSIIEEIDKIEMSNETENWFNNIKKSFNSLEIQQRKPKSGCYIATMTYGDYNHPKVIILRQFRDNYLKSKFIGRVLIEVYYRVSPSLVAVLKDSKLFIKTSKICLDLFVKILIKRTLD